MENELGFMVRDENIKYILSYNGDELMVDLENDPGEMIKIPYIMLKRKGLKICLLTASDNVNVNNGQDAID